MKASSKLMGVVCSVLLTACGGSGDGDSKTGAQIAIIEDGIYNGAQSLTIRFSSGGTKPDPSSPNIRIHVNAGEVYLEKILDGKVNGRTGISSINNGQFSVILGRDFAAAKNTKCKGSQTYSGSINTSIAKGSIEGKLDCTDNKGPYQQFLSGAFNATK
ncbi:MAG: hypothetical protein V3V09_04875 [Arenicellales bacterium]